MHFVEARLLACGLACLRLSRASGGRARWAAAVCRRSCLVLSGGGMVGAFLVAPGLPTWTLTRPARHANRCGSDLGGLASLMRPRLRCPSPPLRWCCGFG